MTKNIALLLLPVVASLFLGGCAGMPQVNTYKNVHANIAINRQSRIAVLPDVTTASGDFSLPNALGTELLGLGFNVIERTVLFKLLNEQSLSLSGIMETADYSKIGQIANVDIIIIVSSQVRCSSIASATVKTIDLTTGQILLSTNYFQPSPCNSMYVYYQNINQTAQQIARSIVELFK